MATDAGRLKRELTNLPNLLTYARIVAVPACVLFLGRGDPKSSYVACAIYVVAGATDYFDGWLARRMNLTSVLGKFLDPLADKLFVMAALILLVHLGRVPAWLVVIILAREMTITGLRSIASAEGMVIGAGYTGKLKTALQMVALCFLLIHYEYTIHFLIVSVQLDMQTVGLLMLYLSVFFSLWSAAEYFAGFFRHLSDVPD